MITALAVAGSPLRGAEQDEMAVTGKGDHGGDTEAAIRSIAAADGGQHEETRSGGFKELLGRGGGADEGTELLVTGGG